MVEETVEETTQQNQENSPQSSFREMRDKLKSAEERINALTQQIEQSSRKEDDFDVSSLPDDYLLEAKDYKRQRQKDLEMLQRVEERTIQLDLRDKYSDFKEVCTPDNIRKLKEVDPVLAQTILMNPNAAHQWELVYKGIKMEGIYQPKDKEREENDMVAGYNSTRPKTLSQVKSSKNPSKTSPLGEANVFGGALTQEQKNYWLEYAKKKISGE